MDDWKWRKVEIASIAKFVNPKAANLLRLPQNYEPLNATSAGRRQCVELIYQTLLKQSVRYAQPEYSSDSEIQPIRQPIEVLQHPGSGTCLDLALLFCGICLGYRLLPILIVVEGHALVAVSLKHSLSEWDSYGAPRSRFNKPEPLNLSDLETLKTLIEAGEYLAIECTGVAEALHFVGHFPEAQERTDDGFLSFERSIQAGREQLSQPERPFKFAIDLAVAHHSWKISSLPIDLPHQFQHDHSSIERTQETYDVVWLDEKGQLSKRDRHQASCFIEWLGNGVILKMIEIPAGSAQLGSPITEEGRSEDEELHSVEFKSFFIGQYPITQAQWSAIAALPKIRYSLDPEPSYFKGCNRPVEKVSWYNAVEFCARLSQATGRSYRLPTASEWEYACRAGTTTPFHFGETLSTDWANYCGEDRDVQRRTRQQTRPRGAYGKGTTGCDRKETTEVGYFQVANSFGLYDVHGNVWEWCSYRWSEADANINQHASEVDQQALRGGSWKSSPIACRAASCLQMSPDHHSAWVGFRVVYCNHVVQQRAHNALC